MKRTFDTASAVKILRDGIAKGYWTLEDLDTPSPNTQILLDDYRRYCSAQGYIGVEPKYRNLLRDAEDNQQDDFIL